MTGRFFRIPFNSIRFKLIVGVVLITVPLSLLLIYTNYYAIGVVRSQVADSNKKMMSLYMGQIDEQLRFAESYLMGLTIAEADFTGIENKVSESERIFALSRLSNRITENMLNFKSVDGFFIYSVPNQYYLNAFREVTNYAERESVRNFIEDETGKATPNLPINRWYVQEIGEKYYLLRTIKVSDTYVGTWILFDNLMMPLNLIGLGENGEALFTTNNGVPLVNAEIVRDNRLDVNKNLQHYYLSGDAHRYLVVGEKSAVGNFNLIALIPDEQILRNLPILRNIVNCILIGVLILLPVCLLLLRKTVLLPINRLILAMKRIKDGNLDMRIQSFRTSDEFQLVYETFNNMMSQIQELRIHVYEEQMNKQKAELQHLQLQINPHFYLNSLNIMHTLARAKNYALIEEMAQCLVGYFRYMFRSNLTFVSVQEELQHVRNYLRIQELRFPNHLQCTIHVPDYLLRTPIPPLVVQTFVENAIKHAVTMDEPVLLTIDMELDDAAVAPTLKITIQDTGPGFPEDVLEGFRSGTQMTSTQGEHIGIWNVQQRLLLLYQSRAEISFANSASGGAVIVITLPLQPDMEKGERL
ncbi:sensor histidine kinase [Paenibacillus aceris]|uniref:Two-component system sensor histidine kinase YesM n=1 Tax=Paenibacillus aceris TaxID=869555 RepID=A0ABS4HWV8_9BACL|nr:histidine kinase [Paenibacillus aceris]MBP1963038.1 two-component system sensor histidine kinase YesM [Paenibacillus aceris]NHW38452.1 histidine kinase [Paenibacillus aceris]